MRHLQTDEPARTASHLCVLMAIRNGQPYLTAQIESVTAQHHSDWSLLVSDDGSTDGSPKVVRSFAHAQPGRIRLITGPQTGYGDNFRALILSAGKAGFYALADQDDVWLPERLTRSIALLQAHGDTPAIALAQRSLVDQNLSAPRPEKPLHDRLEFRNALFESVTPGNTLLINAPAFDILRKAMSRIQHVSSHDWFIYQIATGAGFTFLYDDQPTVLYRQHDRNTVGAKAGLRQLMWRSIRFSNSNYLALLNKAWQNLALNSDLLTPENRTLLDTALALPSMTHLARWRAFRKSGFYRAQILDHFLLEYVLIPRMRHAGLGAHTA